MKLRIHNCVKGPITKLLVAGFPLVTKYLGIDGYKGTIEVHSGSRGGEEGGVSPDATPRTQHRIMTGKRCDEFQMMLKPGRPETEMFATFCHEMVHVKQLVIGELGVRIMPDGELQQLYHNVRAENDEIPYRDRPWEKEAFDKMHVVAEVVLKQLVREKERKGA